MNDVLLVNASYQVLSRIDWQRAVVLVVTDEAEAVESHPTQLIHSQHLVIPFPTIIRLRTYRHVDHRTTRERRPTFPQVKLRDGRTCGYCGGFGDTIDHIMPQCRGGQNTWDNLITACRPCNNRKADRTPVEAGMRLLWIPRPLVPDDSDQQRVWRALGVA
ncbi:HNH endonuclease [Nakamurella sp. A5-74]|uniref:HNH endonuclease n=1 Tax=Nakamurella sp. A5-74 TaxID=3158264 RepID=A0AAU8DTG9_9ACTN